MTSDKPLQPTSGISAVPTLNSVRSRLFPWQQRSEEELRPFI